MRVSCPRAARASTPDARRVHQSSAGHACTPLPTGTRRHRRTRP